jgi:hypothetical protein
LHFSPPPDSARLFYYLPDFSALWGHFFFIARKKSRFWQLRRGRERSRPAPRERSRGPEESAERRREQLFACVRGPSRYDEREIRDAR